MDKQQIIDTLSKGLDNEKIITDLLALLSSTHRADNIDYCKHLYGYNFIKYFMIPEIIDTKCKKGLTFLEFISKYETNELKPSVYKLYNTILNDRPNTHKLLIYKQLYNLYYGAITIFRPTMALHIYSRYRPRRILDPTMGWGGRLIGAIAYGADAYIGIDLNENLRPLYDNMINTLRPYSSKTAIDLRYMDALTVDYSTIDYDCVFTSPPYYNTEKYNNMVSRRTKKIWDNEFYIPLFETLFKHLKINGFMAINVSTEIYNNSLKKCLGDAHEITPLYKCSRHINEYKEYIYIYYKT